MIYKIEWDIRAYRELRKLDNKGAVSILNAVSKFVEDPKHQGKPLKGKFKGKMRLRVGNYRVICWVHEKETMIYIISVGHRKYIY